MRFQWFRPWNPYFYNENQLFANLVPFFFFYCFFQKVIWRRGAAQLGQPATGQSSQQVSPIKGRSNQAVLQYCRNRQYTLWVTVVQYNTRQDKTIQYTTAVANNTIPLGHCKQCNAVQYNAMQCNAIQCNTAETNHAIGPLQYNATLQKQAIHYHWVIAMQ